MPRVFLIILLIFLTTADLSARETVKCSIPVDLEKLSDKAAEKIYTVMDSDMLRFFNQFSSRKNLDDALTEEIFKNLNYICIHNFKFDKESKYTGQDFTDLINQLSSPVWTQADVKSERADEDCTLFVRVKENFITGMAIIFSGKSQLDFIYFDGMINALEVHRLIGKFGATGFDMGSVGNRKRTEENQ